MKRRSFLNTSLGLAGSSAFFPICGHGAAPERAIAQITSGSSVNIPVEQRTGEESIVYFTRDLSPAGISKIYQRISQNLTGKLAVKLHTGEQNGPNIIPSAWVKEFFKNLPNPTIVETNTYYQGDRDTTEKHLRTLEVNGWNFCPVDIMDAEGTAYFPASNTRHLKEISMGRNLGRYDSLLVLTHFKGHTMGGFGGSNKNIGIGCADAKIGKRQIHAGDSGSQWGITHDEFMERMTESSKAVLDHFGKNIAFINVMRRMSVDCDCAGLSAAPPEVPDFGILGSLDILALDAACIDMVYNMGAAGKPLQQRIESRHGLRQLSYMKEIGMGSDKYRLVCID